VDKTKDKPVKGSEAQSEYCKATRDSCKKFMMYMQRPSNMVQTTLNYWKAFRSACSTYTHRDQQQTSMLTTSTDSLHKDYRRRKSSP
jgi:hypothetical protein